MRLGDVRRLLEQSGGQCEGVPGRLDKAGFLFITGRQSDMYISGGSNVYPRETEEALLGHPALAEVAIVGVPDATWGEVGVAAAVLRPGSAGAEAERLAWLDGKVSRYKLPRRVFVWEALPRSGDGMITKKAVREELVARGCVGQPDLLGTRVAQRFSGLGLADSDVVELRGTSAHPADLDD